MIETELQEWEQYDARLDDTPFTRPAPAGSRLEAENFGVREAFESPFLTEMGGEVSAEMENEAFAHETPHECRCSRGGSVAEAFSEAETLTETENLQGLENDVSAAELGENEAQACSAGCLEPSAAYIKTIRPRGNPEGSVIERTQGDSKVNLSLQLFDYDVNEFRPSKNKHREALTRVREFIVDRTVQTKEKIAVTITGLASRTGSAAYNDVLSCKRAECAADNIRQSLSFFRGVSERVVFNTTGEGFTRATCKGSDCELGEWRSVLVQVHTPNTPPKPVPPVDPGWDKYTIRCCSFRTRTLAEAALEELLKKLPNIPESVKGKLMAAIRKGIAKLIQQLTKQLPKLGSALKGIGELLKLFPAQLIQETAVFEISERDKPNSRKTILCYSGFGLRIAVPNNLDEFLDLAFGKTPGFQGLPDAVKKQIKDGIKKLIPEAVKNLAQPIGSESPGPLARFDLLHPRNIRVFSGSVQIGKGVWMPGQVNVEFNSPPWNRPDPIQRPHITKCPDTDCNGAGVQTIVGAGKGIEFFSISTGDLVAGSCECLPAVKSKQLEATFENQMETEFESEFETQFETEAEAETEFEMEAESKAEAETELEAETEFETEARADSQESRTDETESFEADPYSSIRPAMSPEHANLTADEVTVVLGRMPANLALHQLLNSPATRQATLASLLGRGARRSVRINGANISIPGYLHVLSRLCREVAEHEGESEKAPIASPPGVQKYRDDASRRNYNAFFKLAIQRVAGKTKLTAREKATLADAIADASVRRARQHSDGVRCALGAVPDDGSRTRLKAALSLSGPWGDAFHGALQTTPGGESESPEQLVAGAAELADQAVLAAGELDESLWAAFMKCKRR